MTKPVPDGIAAVTPMLVCRDAEAELEFCKTVFGGAERVRRPGADGTVAHALVAIGEALVMIEAEFPSAASRAPKTDGSSPVVIYVYVSDVDKVVKRAVIAGAEILAPVQDQFWGDRTGRIVDPAGHVWIVSTRIEETTEQERAGRWSKIRSAQS